MIKNNKNVDDCSRNRSNNKETLFDRDVQETLMEAVKKTAGISHQVAGYELNNLAKFFRENFDFYKYLHCRNDVEKGEVILLFKKISTYLDFAIFLQKKVIESLSRKFTTQQIACICQAYNGILIDYSDDFRPDIKEELYDYMYYDSLYDFGEFDEFKAKIEAINPVEYAVLINLIQEAWYTNDDYLLTIIGSLSNDVKAKGLKSFPIPALYPDQKEE